jgi:hypothetical protein
LGYINDSFDKNSLNELTNQNNVNYITKVCSKLNPETIKQCVEHKHTTEVKNIVKHNETSIKALSDIVANQKNVESEYQSILKEISAKDNQISEIIDYYSDYLKHNKNFLIRNEILKFFLDKIIITKEDKDNLLNKTLYDDKFFKLIFKMNNIAYNIKLIDRNNEKLSKNLIFSIKENFNIMDDLLNEKIVLYLKNLFRSNNSELTIEQFKNMRITLFYLKDKTNYLGFILKEYTQMRRRVLEESLKAKYYKIARNEDIFQLLIEDVEKNFLKEFILMTVLFNIEEDLLTREEESLCLELFNNRVNEGVFEKLLPRITEFKKMKDFSFHVNYLNSILYSLDELFYENINQQKNLQKQDSIAEVYKITIVSYYYESRLDKLFKNNNFNTNENFNIFSIISNTKKTFSKSLSKIINDTHKNLSKLRGNTINYLKEDNIITNSNEAHLTKVITNLTEEYSKVLSDYYKYSNELTVEDKEGLVPTSQNALTLLIEFFNNDLIRNETNINILLKILNLINIIVSKLGVYDIDLKSLKECFDRSESVIVSSFISNILKATKFEENLKNNISHEQTINLIEHILEKSNL